jgi:tRNA A22 N-methylase
LSEEVKELYSKILIIDLKISNIVFDIKKFAYTTCELTLEEKEYKFLSLRDDSTNNEYEFTTETYLEEENKIPKILKEENEEYSL